MSVSSFSLRTISGSVSVRIRPTVQPLFQGTATGGTTSVTSTPIATFQYHVFCSGGTFSVTAGVGSVEYMVVGGGGGGGGGGDAFGGGGGAGGLVYRQAQPITSSPGSYPIVIGGGGGGTGGGQFTSPPYYSTGGPGGNSCAFGIIGFGGGGGGTRLDNTNAGACAGCPGGNGGGVGASPAPSFGTGFQPSCNPGGSHDYQIGNPGRNPANDPPEQRGWGGSSNPGNDATINPQFPNQSTILTSNVCLCTANIGRGGRGNYASCCNHSAVGSFGCGGSFTQQAGCPGQGGLVVIRYVKDFGAS